MITEQTIRRNAALVRRKMEQQLESSLKKGADYIDQELAGPHNFLLRPIIKTFYNAFARPDLNSGSMGNLQIVLDAATEIVTTGTADLEAVLTKYFPRYLKNDQTAKYCRKTHKDYPWFVENVKATFRSQLKGAVKMIGCTVPAATSYDDLAVASFVNKDEAKAALMEQFDCMQRGIERIDKDQSILEIPAGKQLIINVIKRGIKDEREFLMKSIDAVFG